MILSIKKTSAILLLLSGMISLGTSVPDRPMMVYFLGDSIPRRSCEPEGYITQLRHIIDSTGRGRKYNLSCAGEDGNTIADISLRLDRDIISHQPDMVFILIGANDACQRMNPISFERTYDSIIQRLLSTGAQIVICTPMCISEKTKHDSPKDRHLDRLVRLVRDIALRNKCQLCDIRKTYLDLIHSDNSHHIRKNILTTDGIHPNRHGSLIIAQEMSGFLR
jgi:lysophospholipase L1-like esterase